MVWEERIRKGDGRLSPSQMNMGVDIWCIIGADRGPKNALSQTFWKNALLYLLLAACPLRPDLSGSRGRLAWVKLEAELGRNSSERASRARKFPLITGVEEE